MFTLKFPFRLPDHQQVETDLAIRDVGGLNFSLVGGKPYAVLKISGFATSEQASNYIRNAWSGLMWNLMEVGISPIADLVIQEAVYYDDPIKAGENFARNFGAELGGSVDGAIDGSSPAVYESNKTMRTFTGGRATAVGGFSSTRVLDKFVEGASFCHSSELIADEKLKVALELYGAYFTESSANARFLTLIMALEAMTTGEKRPRVVQELFRDWEVQAMSLAEAASSSEDKAALESVVREIMHKKDDSLRSQIRRLVKTTLEASGAADADDASRQALRLYDLRSTLVHTGRLPGKTLETALADAKTLVHRVLRSAYMDKAVE